MFRNPFSFEGRIRRMEYGLSIIIYYAAAVLAGMALSVAVQLEPSNLTFIFLWIPLIYFMLAQGAKRCHDIGRSGWWQLIPFYALWMIFVDGEPENNDYGPDPKRRGDLIEQFLIHDQYEEEPV